MDIRVWWPLLDAETRDWLIEHNGEPLPPTVVDGIKAAAGGTTDSHSWANESPHGLQLSDGAVDWIETVANGEDPSAS
ncbi:hypothetical protein ACRB8A_14770 [Arthrobacter sp. G.S.26]|uniref:hypothetical protein n=1 Tax=Arthrobacter sp. G.S.26 TaxID=3433706 RepID=UPI003D785858